MKCIILTCIVFFYNAEPSSAQQLASDFADQVNDYLWTVMRETFAELQWTDQIKAKERAKDTVANFGGLTNLYNWKQWDSKGDVPISSHDKILNLDIQPHNSGVSFYDLYKYMILEAVKFKPFPFEELTDLGGQLAEVQNELAELIEYCDKSWDELGDTANYPNKEAFCEDLGITTFIDQKWHAHSQIAATIREILADTTTKLTNGIREVEQSGMHTTKIADAYGNVLPFTYPNWITTPSPDEVKGLYDVINSTKCINRTISVSEQFTSNSEQIFEGTGLNFFTTYIDGNYRIIELDNTFRAEFRICFHDFLPVTVHPDEWYVSNWVDLLEKSPDILDDNWSLCKEEGKLNILGDGGILNSIIKNLLVVSAVEMDISLDFGSSQLFASFNPDDFRIANICTGRSCYITGNVLIGFDNSPSTGSYDSSTNTVSGGWLYVQHAVSDILKAAFRASSAPNTIAVLGSPPLLDPTDLSGSGSNTAISAVAHILRVNVTFYDGPNGIRDFFTSLASYENDPKVIWIPDDLDPQEIDSLVNYAGDLNLYAASGGGIVTHGSPDTHKWLFELVPYAQYSNLCERDGSVITAQGHEWFNSVTAEDVQAGTCSGHLTTTEGSCLGFLDKVALDGNGLPFIFSIHGGITMYRECGVFPAPTPSPTAFPSVSPTPSQTPPPTAVPTAPPTPPGFCHTEADDWVIVSNNNTGCGDGEFECPGDLERWVVFPCCGCKPRSCAVYELTGRGGNDAFINGIYVEHELLNGKMSFFNAEGAGLYLYWYDAAKYWLLSYQLGGLSVFGYAEGGQYDVQDARWMMADPISQQFVYDPNIKVTCVHAGWCDVDLKGVSGCAMDFNGEFVVQNPLYNGRPLYKLAGEDVYIYYRGENEVGWVIVLEDSSSVDFLSDAVDLAFVSDAALSIERIQEEWICYRNAQEVGIRVDITCRLLELPAPTEPPGPGNCILDFPGKNGTNHLVTGVYAPTDQFHDNERVYYDEVDGLYLYFLEVYGFWLTSLNVGSVQTYGYCDGADIFNCTWNVAENGAWEEKSQLSARCADWCNAVVSGCGGCSDINGSYKKQDELHNGRPYYYSRSSQYFLYFATSPRGWYISETLGEINNVRAKADVDANSAGVIEEGWLVQDDNNVYDPSTMRVHCDGVLLEVLSTNENEIKRKFRAKPNPDHVKYLLQLDEQEDQGNQDEQGGQDEQGDQKDQDEQVQETTIGIEERDPSGALVIHLRMSHPDPIILGTYGPHFVLDNGCPDDQED